MTDCRPEIVGALTVCEMRRVYYYSDLNYATEEDKKREEKRNRRSRARHLSEFARAAL